MTNKPVPKRTLERKKREAEALKANMKKRKEQTKAVVRAHKDSNKNEK